MTTSPPSTSNGSGSETDDDHFAAAVDHAWNWFALHSGQRMQFVNFLIVALSLTMAAYATAMSQDKKVVAGAIAVGGLVLSGLFQRLDVRTRELVQACEPAMKEIEARLSRQSGISVDFVRAVEKPAKRLTTYRVSLRILTITFMTAFLIGAVYAFAF